MRQLNRPRIVYTTPMYTTHVHNPTPFPLGGFFLRLIVIRKIITYLQP